MLRSFVFLAPVLLSAGGGAIAATYTAAPVKTPAEARLVVRDLIWNCDGARCTARQDSASSRPAIICAATARKLGPLSAFAVDGEALGQEALAKCNSRAE